MDTSDKKLRRNASYVVLKRLFSCEICSKYYTNEGELYVHNIQHQERNSSGTYSCPFPFFQCPKTHKYRSVLVQHVSTHFKLTPFTCNEPNCGRGFVRNGDLTIHKKRFHSTEKLYQCDLCKDKFSTTSDLASHREFHNKSTFVSCKICNKTFKGNRHLRTHMKMHNDTRKFHCTHCDGSFKDRNLLNRHIDAVHLKLRPFDCNIFSKSYTTRSNLNNHIRTHTGEKPYNCEHCDKSFTSGVLKIQHKNTHHPIKTIFECKLCPKTFEGYGSLKHHGTFAHRRNKSKHKCPLSGCDKSFSNNYLLSQHLFVHTREKPFHCELCNKSFNTTGSLNTHKILHRNERKWKCHQCNKGFNTKPYLETHRKFVHSDEKLYSCPICECSFKTKYIMQNHTRTHTGEKQFGCQMCERSFKYHGSVKHHMKIIHGS